MRSLNALLATSVALALVACGGGADLPRRASPVVTASIEGTPAGDPAASPAFAPAQCSAEDVRQTIRNYMSHHYYWFDKLPAGDPTASTGGKYFDSVLYKTDDRFSYSEPTAAFNQFFTAGRRVGFGYTVVWEDAARTVLRVRSVEPQSPVAKAGLRRGDRILSIDGHGPAAIAAGTPPAVSTPGVSRTFRVQGVEGTERTITAVSEDFPLTVVAPPKTFDVAREDGTRGKVGYLSYQSFVSYGRGPLGEAFRGFAEQEITDLVLDLRYNGGGSVIEARDLASMILGWRGYWRLFTYLRFNPNNPGWNESIRYNWEADRLPGPMLPYLRQVIVITSPATASASELVINGLKPFMPVVLVGAPTYGKPYGFVPRNYCGTTYNAVHFETLNAEGVGGYTSGFEPHCAAADDLDRELGDSNEARLKTALFYAKHDRCPAPPPMALAWRKQVRDGEAFGEVNPNVMVRE